MLKKKSISWFNTATNQMNVWNGTTWIIQDDLKILLARDHGKSNGNLQFKMAGQQAGLTNPAQALGPYTNASEIRYIVN